MPLFFDSSGQRGEQGASEARKRPSGAFVARCACRGAITPRASLVARSKKEVTTYVVTSFLDSGRKLKCSGEVNSPSAKALLRKKRRASFALFLQNDLKAMENIAIIQLKNKNAAAYGCANTHMPAQVSLPPTQ
jgi:hypothetical protein